jgi:RsiW-degrading membrane proteinase PrsW (M82 family)
MKRAYWLGSAAIVVGLAAVVWGFVDSGRAADAGLFIGAAALPTAILFWISGRTGLRIAPLPLVAGATIAPALALVGQTLVFAFAYFFFLGFADAALSAVETLRIDSALVDVAGSPWTLLLFFEVVLVAPFIEELGKGISSSVERPGTRAEAFMAGVAAGVGFAIVENMLFAVGAILFGGPWAAIVSARALGAAIHPLAAGIVAIGWWEWRSRRDAGLLAKRFFSGVGVHALWNGAIVVLGIVGEAYGSRELIAFGSVAVVYAAGLGVIAAWALWRVTALVTADHASLAPFAGSDAKALAAWVLLASSLLVPVALLFLAYPKFAGG